MRRISMLHLLVGAGAARLLGLTIVVVGAGLTMWADPWLGAITQGFGLTVLMLSS